MNEEPLKANHIMLDLETLSTSTIPMLLQVSMVSFHLDPVSGESKLISILDQYPSLDEQEEAGAHIDLNTVEWWQKSNPIKFTELMNKDRSSLRDFRIEFEKFIRSCVTKVKIWARSPSFDCAKISGLWSLFYQTCAPWKFFDEMDVRTVCSMFHIDGDFGATEDGKHIWIPELKGREKHDALYDCFVQSNCVIEAYKRLPK